MYNEIMSDRRSINGHDPIAFCTFHSFLVEVQMKLGSSTVFIRLTALGAY